MLQHCEFAVRGKYMKFRCLFAMFAVAALSANAETPSAATAAAKTTAPALVSPDAFFADPAISDAELSPSGRFMAYVLHKKDSSAVVVEDLNAVTLSVAIGNLDKNISFDWVQWKSEDRLVAGVTYLQIFRLNQKDPNSDITGWKYGKYMVAADRNGANQVVLFKGDKSTSRKTGNIMRLLDSLKHDPDHILAVLPSDAGDLAVWRADIHTGAASVVEKGDSDTIGWDTDRNGDIIARYQSRYRTLTIEGRAPGETKWSQVVRIKQKDLEKEVADFELLDSGEAPGTLYVAKKPEKPEDGDTRSIHLYDFRTRTLGPPVWPTTKFDIESIVTNSDTNVLEGVCYWVDTYQCDFKDPQMQATMRGIANYFHNDRNVTEVSRSDDGKWWLFNVTGPNDEGSYYLYDWTKHELTQLGEQYPDLPSERLGQMQRYVFTSHDGLKIPGYLTRPAGAPSGPLPLVVLPHGGPMVRDNFDFDLWSQFIASRGYLVYQPNYRGSGGYGQHWLEAGFHQWGGLMQDDVAEGVRSLISDGLVDPSRICVFGGSYGGYTALMQGALHPELYKCVVSWAGISDLDRFIRNDRSTDEVYQYELKELGDPAKDKADLAKQSAITYAATYRPPVLLVHGDQDSRVAIDQSRAMERALKSAKRDVRLIVVQGEDHSDWSDDNEKKTLGDVADFIKSHIAPAPLSPPPAPAPPTN